MAKAVFLSGAAVQRGSGTHRRGCHHRRNVDPQTVPILQAHADVDIVGLIVSADRQERAQATGRHSLRLPRTSR